MTGPSDGENDPTDELVVPTVGEIVEAHARDFKAGQGRVDNREDFEADIAAISARLGVLRAYLLPMAKKRLRAENVEDFSAVTGEAEHLLRGLQGTLHGQANFNARGSVVEQHAAVVRVMKDVTAAEKTITERLDRILTPRQSADLVKKLESAHDRAPTRPHPYTPHPPGLARLFFRASAASDRLMDTMDSRVLPPAKPKPPAETAPSTHDLTEGTP